MLQNGFLGTRKSFFFPTKLCYARKPLGYLLTRKVWGPHCLLTLLVIYQTEFWLKEKFSELIPVSPCDTLQRLRSCESKYPVVVRDWEALRFTVCESKYPVVVRVWEALRFTVFTWA
jgi:hypothetical protein